MERADGPGMAALVDGVEDLVEIGRGGFSVVYRGRQPALGRDVAVKVVSSRGTPEADLERWRREVTAMGRLSNHPNIVAVYAGGVTGDGSPYLVLPYVPGGSLRDRLQSEGPLAPAETAELGAKLAGALSSAHAAGVLHRDLKPDNILISPYGEPQLTDFGIARLLDSTATATGQVHATIPYAPPEVLSGARATEQSDVYGLGATLYACLTGAPPFPSREDDTLLSLVARAMTQPPTDLRRRGVPDALASVLERAMAKDPVDRISSADEFKRLLETTGPALAAGPRPAPADLPVGEGWRNQDSRTSVFPVAAPAPRPPRGVSAASAPPPPPPPPAPAPALTAAPMVVPPPLPPLPPRPQVGGARSPRGARRQERTQNAAIAVVVALILLTLGGLAFALTSNDGGSGDTDVPGPAQAGPPPTGSDGDEPRSTTTAPRATTTTVVPAPAPAAAGSPDRAALAYFEAIGRRDFDAAYAMFTPAFRAAQSLASFEEYWGGFGSVRIVGPPTVDGGTVVVPLDLDGSSSTFSLQLTQDAAGTWMVDGPRPG